MINKRNYINIIFVWAFIGFTAVGCAPKSPSSSKDKTAEAYSEDLSVLRKTFENPSQDFPLYLTEKKEEKEVLYDVKYDITKELHTLIDSLTFNYRKSNFINGFTIQVYMGNSSEKADEIKELVEELLLGEIAVVQYRPPNYRVQVGSFVEKLEVQKTLALVKSDFPNAIIVPHRIKISDF